MGKYLLLLFNSFFLILTKFLFQQEDWALGDQFIRFCDFPDISQFPKSDAVWQLVMQLVYNMFICNNRPLLHLWLKEKFIKHQKVSIYYENNCLQNFLQLLISLLTTPIVKNSHIQAMTCFIFLKIVLKKLENQLIPN